MHISFYLPESSKTKLTGFKINVTVVSVVFDDFITGRRRLLATVAVHADIRHSNNSQSNAHWAVKSLNLMRLLEWDRLNASLSHKQHQWSTKYFKLHRVPKFAPPLLQTHLIQFVVHEFWRHIVHCTIITLLTITAIMTSTLYCVCSV